MGMTPAIRISGLFGPSFLRTMSHAATRNTQPTIAETPKRKSVANAKPMNSNKLFFLFARCELDCQIVQEGLHFAGCVHVAGALGHGETISQARDRFVDAA